MEIIALLALVAIAGYIAYRLTRDRRAAPPMSSELLILRESITELRTAQSASIGELRQELRRSLGETEQQVLTQTGSTQRALSDLARQLGALGEQSTRVGDLAKDIGSLHDLLRAPKLRGGFGELLMQRVLEDALPAGSYELQYGYRGGQRVDAVVRFGGRLVPIDAKFPMESFHALAAAADEPERKAKRRAFVQAVKRHVDAVSRYISPEDGTIDYALMYIPAEQVFYEAMIRGDDADLRDHCAERHVIPTSPNTLLAYLQLVSFGLRGLAMQERTREIQAAIRHASLELERFRDAHEVLGRHLDNASKKYQDSIHCLDRTGDALEALSRAPAVEQPPLPLAQDVPEARALDVGAAPRQR